MISRQDISVTLRHPFTLLLATALISGWLVPRITRSWQDHQRRGELKVQLVTEAGNSAASMLVTAQFSEFGGSATNQEEINRAFRAWETEQVVVSTKIRAYVDDVALAKDWDTLSHMITLTYAMSAKDAPRRKEYLAELRTYISDKDVNWSALEAGYSDEKFDEKQFLEYNRAWYQLKAALLDRYGKLVQRILDADIRW
jgi:hypothetical protein